MPDEDEWALQADAAQIAGCSVSAIRKWRREGVVGDRRTTTTGGLERVEVRVQDVLDRCGREPRRNVAESIDGPQVAGPGTVFLALADLQALILNLGESERRAHEAMGRMTVMEIETLRLTDALTQAEAGRTSARSEVEDLRRRVRELKATAAGEAPQPPASGTENERLREQLATLQAKMAESRNEMNGQRRRIRELEARPAALTERALVAESENERLRQELHAVSARLSAAKNELDGQRRRIRDLESLVELRDRSPVTATTAPIGPTSTRMPVPQHAGPPRPNDQARPPAPVASPSTDPREQPGVPRGVKAAVQRWRGHRPAGTTSGPGLEHDLDPMAAQLRRLYHRLQSRRVEGAASPDEGRRWIADLAAYDEALIVACIELGVPTSFEPGDRLPAEERVALTRALGDAGLDVRQQIAS